MDLAFYGRVSTEDAQDPEASRAWQRRRALDLVSPLGHGIVEDFFDIGQSRSLPWKRRPEAARLLEAVADPHRGFDGIVVGEPQRAFYGNQFSLTFPVLVHYDVQLWVPEVGGRVDPDSEIHDLMMSLFGGMSKGERSRIRTRTRVAMHELAANTDRFLGGRPPYGYQLGDVGPHPNPSKAVAGQRAHRLEPDPVTAPFVVHIFEMYARGMGLRDIAQRLTDEGIPSPSAYDRARNSHRDPRGWSHAAVRAILANPTYSGVRTWGKQEKYETLVDVADVAVGTQVRMRWRDEGLWVVPGLVTHEPLVDAGLLAAARARLGARGHNDGTRKPRESAHAYPLRGLLCCAACGRKMQGAYRAARGDGPGRVLYRCEVLRGRSLPLELADHARTVYLNQAAVLPSLDAWIASDVTDPQWLMDAQRVNVEPPEVLGLRRKIREVNVAIGNLTAAIERGVTSEAVLRQLQQREAERTTALAQLSVPTRSRDALSAADIQAVIDALGGVSVALSKATDVERAALYASLGLSLQYDYRDQTVAATADLARVASCVRRGTCPLPTRSTVLRVA